MFTRRQRVLGVLMAGVIAATTGQVKRASSADLPAGWEHDWKTAMSRAAATGKPILAVFSAEWCGPCQMMVKEVYPLPGVQAELENWIHVYVDEAKDPATTAKFKIEGFPTFVLLSSQAQEEDRFVGARPAAEFVAALKDHKRINGRIIELKAQLEHSPEDAQLWAALATAYDEKGKAEAALTGYEKALFYDPKDRAGVADNYYFLKALPTTMESLKTSAEKLAAFETKFPESELLPKVFLYRGWIAADLDRTEEAVELLQEGLRRFPTSELAATMKQTLEEIGVAHAH